MKRDDVVAADYAKVEAPPEVPRGSWYALAILTLIYSCHFLDRTMIAIVLEPVKAEFGLNDSQLGLLTGLAYGLTFALAGIPLGYLIDRRNRVRLLAVLVTIWSGMTLLSGMAQNYLQLVLARMGVGAAESGGSPTSLSLISDYFPPAKRSTAVGCFFLSNAVGAVASIIIGGVITAHYGWRAAMLVAGAPGLLLAVTLLFTVREPMRGANELAGSEVVRLGAALRTLAGNPTMVHLMAGTAIGTAAVAMIGTWLAAFSMRFHGLGIKEAGFVSAMAGGFFAAGGSVLGGMLSDRLAKIHFSRRMILCAVLCFFTLATGLGGILLTARVPGLGLLCLSMFFSFGIFPAAFGAMLGLVAPGMRGVTSAAMQVTTNMIGYGLGPFMVGVLSDFYGGGQSLRYAMATVVVGCCPWAAWHFVRAARHCTRDMRKGEAA